MKIVKGEYKGRKGQILRVTENGEVVVLLDLDGDPKTPPIEVRLPKGWAKALRIINFILDLVLPLLYNLKRK